MTMTCIRGRPFSHTLSLLLLILIIINTAARKAPLKRSPSRYANIIKTGRNVEGRKVQVRNEHVRNEQGRNVQARKEQEWKVHGRNVRGRNVEVRNEQARDMEGRNEQARNVQARNVQARNVQARNVGQQGRNVDVQDVEAENMEAKPRSRLSVRGGAALRGVVDIDLNQLTHYNVSQDPLSQPSSHHGVSYQSVKKAFILSPGDKDLVIRHGPRPARGSLWPMPARVKLTGTARRLGEIKYNYNNLEYNQDVITWYTDRIRQRVQSVRQGEYGDMPAATVLPQPPIVTVNIKIGQDTGRYPTLNSTESYSLIIDEAGCHIMAVEVWGAIRALETFSQLIYTDNDKELVILMGEIHDKPRFKHRGLMIDTSRHYISVDTILHNLEAMSMNKLNVFHWHMVDDQSFPFQSKTFPDLSNKGAFHPDAVYTHDDIALIIAESRLRGIRVIPEFDTPGHTLSWGYGQPNLLTPCYHSHRLAPNGLFGPVHPMLNSTYVFMEKLLREVMSVFQDEYVHLGGDEVPLACWSTNPEIRIRMKYMNMTRATDVLNLLNYYEKRLIKIVSGLGKNRAAGGKSIVWQEVADRGATVSRDTVVQLWKAKYPEIPKYLSQGYKVIFSSCWYADHWKLGPGWADYYQCYIGRGVKSAALEKNLYGGEVCMWNEYADDPEMTTRIWPRASAAAERLWSPADITDLQKAAPRMEQHRCRMMRSGISVGVASGPGYCGEHKRRSGERRSGERRSGERRSGERRSGVRRSGERRSGVRRWAERHLGNSSIVGAESQVPATGQAYDPWKLLTVVLLALLVYSWVYNRQLSPPAGATTSPIWIRLTTQHGIAFYLIFFISIYIVMSGIILISVHIKSYIPNS